MDSLSWKGYRVSAALNQWQGPITAYLCEDHQRLDGYLAAACATGGSPRTCTVDVSAYDQFRAGLLRHIGLEEKILLPAIQRLCGAPWPQAARLRLDHAAIAILLVPTPTAAIIATLRQIMTAHNVYEEAPDGLYATADRVLASESTAIVTALHATPVPHVLPFSDHASVMPAVHRMLARAGYQLASAEASSSSAPSC